MVLCTQFTECSRTICKSERIRILSIAEKYEIDSAYYARMVETKAMYFLDLHQYDSVLVYLKKITNYSRNTEEKCFIYQLLIQLLYRTNQLNQAIPYTKYILENSKYAVYRKNAYYVMIDYAKKHQLLQEIAEYSHAREDEERIVRNLMESYAQASLKLSEHLANPYPFRMVKIVIAVGGILIIIVALGCIIYRKKNKRLAIEKQKIEAELQEWKQHMREKLAIEEENTAAKRKMINDIIMNYAADFALNFAPDENIWLKDKELFRLADSSFGFVIYRLRDTYRDLNNRELKICITILLDFSQKQTAKAVCCAEDSVPNTKKRLAKKLGISPREIRDFLLDFIMQIA